MKILNPNSRRILNLGVIDFETPPEITRLQTDLLRGLIRSAVEPQRYEGLDACSEDQCGRDKCNEACWWRSRRERRQLIPEVHQLFSKHGGPLCEVRLIHGDWARPFGRLGEIDIDRVKQMNGRLLDWFFNTTLIAVGTSKVTPVISAALGGPVWACEIHEIVAGVDKDELERRFTYGRRKSRNFMNLCMVKKVENLGQIVSNVLRRDLTTWWYPERRDFNESWMPKSKRVELYAWLLSLEQNRLLVRYGVDRQFNPVTKKRRKFTRKPKAPRRAGVHLDAFRFGEGEAWERRPAPWEVGFEPRPMGTPREIPNEEYYKELSDDYAEPPPKDRRFEDLE